MKHILFSIAFSLLTFSHISAMKTTIPVPKEVNKLLCKNEQFFKKTSKNGILAFATHYFNQGNGADDDFFGYQHCSRIIIFNTNDNSILISKPITKSTFLKTNPFKDCNLRFDKDGENTIWYNEIRYDFDFERKHLAIRP